MWKQIDFIMFAVKTELYLKALKYFGATTFPKVEL